MWQARLDNVWICESAGTASDMNDSDGLQFRLFGPFEVRRGGELIASGGGKRRAVLAVLLLSPNAAVSAGRIRDLIWGELAPSSVFNLIQGYVSDWRSLLTPDRAARTSGGRLLSTSTGYRLDVDTDECDLLRFGALADAGASAASGDPIKALAFLREALQQRRGPALMDFVADCLEPEAAAIEDRWKSVLTSAAEIELGLDRPDHALALLEPVMRDREPREDLIAVAMTALSRNGRSADALTLYEQTRAALADGLGVDPSPALRGVHLRILREDPLLQRPVEVSTVAAHPPRPLSSFRGRERELAHILELTTANRLVTLTGTGGSGKTRLALEAAPILGDRLKCAVAFVDAANIHSLQLLWPAMAAAIGRTLAASLAEIDALITQLRSASVLFILDNMEHLAGGCGELGRILESVPALRILATSRLPLAINGEQVFTVRPLELPAEHVHELSELMQTPSIQLFVDRARSADADFELTAADAVVLAGICRRLDGLPLCLELAAPWTKSLTLSALLERLDRPLSMLVSHPGGARPDRHRTMRAVIEWSYTAQAPPQRQLLRQLSTFRSGARLDAVEATTDLGQQTLAMLADLVFANLVQKVETGSQPRYRLLETVRAYAHEKLMSDDDEYRSARNRQAQYVLSCARAAAAAVGTPAGGTHALRLDEEQTEIRAALTYLDEVGARREHLTLAVDCLALWWERGFVREGYARLSEALGHDANLADNGLVGAAHLATAMLAQAAGKPSIAMMHEQAAVAAAAKSGSALLEHAARGAYANSLIWMNWAGDVTEGLILLGQACDGARDAPPDRQRWGWLNRHAVCATNNIALFEALRYRDPARARTLALAALDELNQIDESHYAAFAFRALGFLDAGAGRWHPAQAHLDKALDLATRSGSTRNEARTLEELARLAWARGEIVDALGHALDALTLSRDGGHSINQVRCAALLADIHTHRGDLLHASSALDDAERAVAGGYRDLALRAVAPRRARIARIMRDADAARHHLDAVRFFDAADALDPDRVVYLVESAHAALTPTARANALDRLTSALSRLALVLPAPEQDYLDQLTPSV